MHENSRIRTKVNVSLHSYKILSASMQEWTRMLGHTHWCDCSRKSDHYQKYSDRHAAVLNIRSHDSGEISAAVLNVRNHDSGIFSADYPRIMNFDTSHGSEQVYVLLTNDGTRKPDHYCVSNRREVKDGNKSQDPKRNQHKYQAHGAGSIPNTARLSLIDTATLKPHTT